MKRCPRCGQIYTDDMIYCLQDGSELIPPYTPAETETPTVVRPPRTPAATTAGSGKSYLKYLVIALVALLAMGIAGAVGAYFVWTKLSGPEQATANPTPSPSPATTTQPNRTPAFQNKEPQNRPANAERTPEQRTPANTETPPPDNEPDFVDPGTSRITFGRGRVSETVNGRINRNRDFVLRTMAGQNLTARINSERNCVVFSDGGRSIEYSTPQGDSRLSIRNTCPTPARFSLNVSVR